MAYTQPNAQRELANRKILEELQLKKQMLLKQGGVTQLNNSVSAPSCPPPSLPSSNLPLSNIPQISATTIIAPLTDNHMVTTSQRAALNNANATSCGFFVPQDSSFGNQILPVLPRFDGK